MVKANPKATQKKVLDDHKQLGKRFIPPLAQIPNLSEISWRKDIVPNYLWIALLNQKYGHARAAELCVEIAKIAVQIAGKGNFKGWFSAISSYSIFDGSQLSQFISSLEEKKITEYFQNSLKELVYYYPDCPLRFLFSRDKNSLTENPDWLKSFKELLANLIDRTSLEATFVQADAVYIGFITNLLKVSDKTALADFPEIEKYPQTEKSKMVASGIRAMINSLGGFEIKDAEYKWADYFWNRGLEIEACEYYGQG